MGTTPNTKDSPMTPMQPEAQDPNAQAQPSGMTVCIAKLPDGSFSVYPDDDSAEQGAEPGETAEGDEASQGQKAKTVDEALQMAKTMLEGGDAGGMSVEQAFDDGFNGKGPGY